MLDLFSILKMLRMLDVLNVSQEQLLNLVQFAWYYRPHSMLRMLGIPVEEASLKYIILTKHTQNAENTGYAVFRILTARCSSNAAT